MPKVTRQYGVELGLNPGRLAPEPVLFQSLDPYFQVCMWRRVGRIINRPGKGRQFWMSIVWEIKRGWVKRQAGPGPCWGSCLRGGLKAKEGLPVQRYGKERVRERAQ